MNSRTGGWALGFAMALCCAADVSAGFGSGPSIEAVNQMKAARTNPEAVRQAFYTQKLGRDRQVTFLVLLQLHEEKILSTDDLRKLLGDAIVDVDAYIRATAVHYLHVVHDGELLQSLYRRCTLDKSLGVRYNAVERLRAHPSEQSVPYLAALLSDESVEVRGCAADALFTWKMLDVKHVFLLAMNDLDIRRAGCASLTLYFGYRDPPNVELLNRYLDFELDRSPPFSAGHSTCAIIRCLAEINNDSSVAVLRKAAAHKHRVIAEEATRALAKVLAPNGESR